MKDFKAILNTLQYNYQVNCEKGENDDNYYCDCTSNQYANLPDLVVEMKSWANPNVTNQFKIKK